MVEIDRKMAGSALQLAFAAWLSFTIAVLLHVPNPYWAGMPIWVVAQPTRGLLLEKGFYRFIGSLIGAAVGIGILRLPTSPVAHLALLSLWVGVCAAISRTFRATHSYGGLLAGITAGVVVLPSVLNPEQAKGFAIARVECTLIGVVVAIGVTGLFTPRTETESFSEQAHRLVDKVRAFAAKVAEGTSDDVTKNELLSELAAMEEQAYLSAAASPNGYRRHRRLSAVVSAAMDMMAAGLAAGSRRRRGEDGTASSRWRTAQAGLAQALEALGSGDELAERPLGPDRDTNSIWRAAIVAGLATFLSSWIGLLSGWSAGELWALGVCLFSMVLCWMDYPKASAPLLFQGVTWGAGVAMLYKFLLQPHLDTTLAVILSIIPFVIVGGFARVSKRAGMPALDANMCFMMGSGAGMPAVGAAKILNGTAALVLGAGIVAGAILWIPALSPAPDEATVLALRRDLRRLISDDGYAWHSSLSRRILRLQRHFRQSVHRGMKYPYGSLYTLNFAYAVAEIRAATQTASPEVRTPFEEALRLLEGFDVEPDKVIQGLFRIADSIEDQDSASLLRDAGDALAKCGPLFRLGLKRVSRT